MSPRLDPFIEVLLREKGDQLYLLPDEPVTLVKGGKPRKVSKQPVTADHIYALLLEVAPAHAVELIAQLHEAEFDYQTARGLVHVRVLPESGRLTAMIVPAVSGPGAPGETPAQPARPPRPSVIAAAPLVKTPLEVAAATPTKPPPPADTSRPAVARQAEVARPDEAAARHALGELLKTVVESGSSDLHLRVGAPPLFRTLGELRRHGEAALTADHLELLLLSIMPERNRAEWEQIGYTKFVYELAGLARARVTAARDRKGPTGVFRMVPPRVPPAEQLGIPKEVQQLCSLPKGLVLVAGPAASGKSTTLAALVGLINSTRPVHILTIEDPIEFIHENQQGLVTQCEVGSRTGGFAAALHAALGEDADVLLVAELPDVETLSLALDAAERGLLVLAAMPTATATATVDRLLGRLPPDRQAEARGVLAETLKGVIAQTLCKTIAGKLVAAREILLGTPALANLVRDGKTAQIPSVIQTGRKLGMESLNDALLELVEQQVVAPGEAYARAADKAGLASQFRAKGIQFTAIPE